MTLDGAHVTTRRRLPRHDAIFRGRWAHAPRLYPSCEWSHTRPITIRLTLCRSAFKRPWGVTDSESLHPLGRTHAFGREAMSSDQWPHPPPVRVSYAFTLVSTTCAAGSTYRLFGLPTGGAFPQARRAQHVGDHCDVPRSQPRGEQAQGGRESVRDISPTLGTPAVDTGRLAGSGHATCMASTRCVLRASEGPRSSTPAKLPVALSPV